MLTVILAALLLASTAAQAAEPEKPAAARMSAAVAACLDQPVDGRKPGKPQTAITVCSIAVRASRRPGPVAATAEAVKVGAVKVEAVKVEVCAGQW
jgi:hypothetical protein